MKPTRVCASIPHQSTLSWGPWRAKTPLRGDVRVSVRLDGEAKDRPIREGDEEEECSVRTALDHAAALKREAVSVLRDERKCSAADTACVRDSTRSTTKVKDGTVQGQSQRSQSIFSAFTGIACPGCPIRRHDSELPVFILPNQTGPVIINHAHRSREFLTLSDLVVRRVHFKAVESQAGILRIQCSDPLALGRSSHFVIAGFAIGPSTLDMDVTPVGISVPKIRGTPRCLGSPFDSTGFRDTRPVGCFCAVCRIEIQAYDEGE